MKATFLILGVLVSVNALAKETAAGGVLPDAKSCTSCRGPAPGVTGDETDTPHDPSDSHSSTPKKGNTGLNASDKIK